MKPYVKPTAEITLSLPDFCLFGLSGLDPENGGYTGGSVQDTLEDE